uniref:Acid phosphatase, putative n=1 Tax=Arundo donax TaxID=35708 RepID=A0A0A9HKV4_ARUDO
MGPSTIVFQHQFQKLFFSYFQLHLLLWCAIPMAYNSYDTAQLFQLPRYSNSCPFTTSHSIRWLGWLTDFPWKTSRDS